MTYVKINNVLYPAAVNGNLRDKDWNYRDSKSITLEMDYNTALATFVDELEWSIVYQPDSYTDPETGETITPAAEEYDNSDYCVAGSITDHRDGRVTAKMGKLLDSEILDIILGG